MNKLIIKIDCEQSHESALAHVLGVIEGGLVSETNGVKHYCHYTVFRDGIGVYCYPNGKSFAFVVMDTGATPEQEGQE